MADGRLFVWFYVWAVGLSLVLMVAAAHELVFGGGTSVVLNVLRSVNDGSRQPVSTNLEALLALSLFAVHATRRLAESLHITRFNNSQMRWLHVAVAIAFYTAAPYVLWALTRGRGCLPENFLIQPGCASWSTHHY